MLMMGYGVAHGVHGLVRDTASGRAGPDGRLRGRRAGGRGVQRRGLGLIGGGAGDADWVDRELAIAAVGTARPWGVGFLSWAIGVGVVERALERNPRAVMLSFGDPRPFTELIRQAGRR
jgi:hypothetical protein